MRINVAFQLEMPDGRLRNAPLHDEEMLLEESQIPLVGDYLGFDSESGEPGVFRVKSRFFSYRHVLGGSWETAVSIVVTNANEENR